MLPQELLSSVSSIKKKQSKPTTPVLDEIKRLKDQLKVLEKQQFSSIDQKIKRNSKNKGKRNFIEKDSD